MDDRGEPKPNLEHYHMNKTSGLNGAARSNRMAVMWDDRHVGDLSLDRSGAMHFRYSAEWLQDPASPLISIALAKRAESFGDRECKPFFEGLLPEEWQREGAARELCVSAGNPFRLLEALGGDVAGALTLTPGLPQPSDDREPQKPVSLSNHALRDLIDRFAAVPMLAGQGARYSLAGAQSKLPVVLVGDRIALASPGQPTTHIMKPEPARFPGLAANEAFCMALARSVGLNAAEAEWRSVGGKPFVLVSRYDRILEHGDLRRLHQEDFAQGLSVLSSKKYASDGGPVFRDCFGLVRRSTTDPDGEVLKLVDAALFNLIIGNADAHAKNFSLLRRADGDVVLAPLYDLVSTVVWPELSSRFAMKYGRAKTLEDMAVGSFERFADDAGVELGAFLTRSVSICKRVIYCIESGLDVPGLTDQLAYSTMFGVIHDRANRISLKLKMLKL